MDHVFVKRKNTGRAAHLSPQPGSMNKTEAKYAARLRMMELAGEIDSWFFEPAGFRLGEACFYHPDFMVVLPDGVIEFHEVKGRWMDDARVKVKVFADKFPFVVRAVQLKRGQWVFDNF